MSRRTIITDESYRYESVDETTTTVKYTEPVTRISRITRTPSPPACIRLCRSPSVRSITVRRSPSVVMIRPPVYRPRDSSANSVSIRIESNNDNCVRNKLASSSFVNTSYSNSSDYDYKYEYSTETIENKVSLPLSLPLSKSMTHISNIKYETKTIPAPPPPPPVQTVEIYHTNTPLRINDNQNSLTYVYKTDNDNRSVSFVKHTNNDSGLSLEGCLVNSSPTFLPVNRSLEAGAIFNGNSFGLLSLLFIIKVLKFIT